MTTPAPTLPALTAWAVPGIREVVPGDDLAALIGDAVERAAAGHPERALAAGDILVVTSKVVSKAEGRIVEAEDREQAISDETVRVVATRASDGGLTRIVENRLGVVGAAAGVDASNAPEGRVLLLPEHPDASARAIRDALTARFGVSVGVILSDTLGRAWRLGQTDVAIGASGVRLVDDLRGRTDASGKPLAVTQPAVGDELAALGDLVKGKAGGCPVAVVRGAGRFVVSTGGHSVADPEDAEPFTTGRSLTRTGPGDMFRLGTDEALVEGYRRGLAAGLALAAGDDPRWTVVVPFKGGPNAKSRFDGELADSGHPLDRQRLSLAFLRDTLRAVRGARGVETVLVVSGESGADSPLGAALDRLADEIVRDPGTGLNAAVAAGVAAAQSRDARAFVAVLVGDLPALRRDDLEAALRRAEGAARDGHPQAFVADREGAGTTMITAAPGAVVPSRFGRDSRALHAAAGFLELDVPAESSLRNDIDDGRALSQARTGLGEETRGILD